MFIYGGHDIREGTTDTLWSFDLDKMGDLKELSDYSPGPDSHANIEWTKVETTGKSPGKFSRYLNKSYRSYLSSYDGYTRQQTCGYRWQLLQEQQQPSILP